MYKIAIVGPESTGKSSLAVALAFHFKTEFVPEIARVFLDELKRPYEKDDLLEIAVQQCRAENKIAGYNPPFLICDTTLMVVKIWSEVKYGDCHPWIVSEEFKRKYDLYLLTDIDLPWEDDPQREHPHEREYLFDLYLKVLKKKRSPFELISGTDEQRFENAVQAIKKHFPVL